MLILLLLVVALILLLLALVRLLSVSEGQEHQSVNLPVNSQSILEEEAAGSRLARAA